MEDSVSENKRLGIVGGGQLGKMLANAAGNLGIETLFIDPNSRAVARHVAKHLCKPFNDHVALVELFASCSAVTFEFENVSIEALKKVGILEKLAPNLEALYVSNDRIREKEFFQQCGLEVAPHVAVTETSIRSDEQYLLEIGKAGERLGYPVIVKTCSLGYDGKGQVSIAERELDPQTITRLLNLKSSDRLVVEKKVEFSREVSAIAARDKVGNIVVYPTAQNIHKQGILFSSVVTETEPLPELSEAIHKVIERLNYVGVLAIEFFDVGTKFLVNEMAPRVHNSGHWTIEGSVTSQFENHVRAVMGFPLGVAGLRFPTGMINLVGEVSNIDRMLRIPGAHLHLYGKEPRAARKLGHLTIEAPTSELLKHRIEEAAELIA